MNNFIIQLLARFSSIGYYSVAGRGSSVVEHISEKDGVVSSILTRGTSSINITYSFAIFRFHLYAGVVQW